MKRAMISLIMCLALVATLPAQKKTVPLDIKGDTYLVVKTVPFDVIGPPPSKQAKVITEYEWVLPPGVEADENDNVLTIKKAPAGKFTVKVKLRVTDFNAGTVTKDTGTIEVMLGGPDPGPKPPDPQPSDDAPIPAPGFRVLIVEDAENRAKLPAAQEAILFDKTIRDYLATKCVKGDDGKTPERRIWDKGADASGKSKLWQDALKRATSKAKSYPWLLISDGKTGYEGPLPATVDETLTLLKKYGG